jgi:glycosyltransferase involved in cell wall biosynthesis
VAVKDAPLMTNDARNPVLLSPADPCTGMDDRPVFILMACYNGACYVEEQIRSIQEQNFNEWLLIIRDDGSCDSTIELIQRLAQEDSRIHLLEDQDRKNLGASANFSALMQYAVEHGAHYVFFADQDDVWHPDKLGLMLAAMHELEAIEGGKLPLLIYCDLTVVDEQKRVIAPSYVQYSKRLPEHTNLGILMAQNQVIGCACLVNRVALNLAYPVPFDARMHDWWVTILCAAAGKIGYVAKSLVQYRQHAANVSGVKPFWWRVAKFLYSPKRWRSQLSIARHSVLQVKLIQERLLVRNVHLRHEAEQLLSDYASLLAIPALRRLKVLKACGSHRTTVLEDMIFKLLMILLHREK